MESGFARFSIESGFAGFTPKEFNKTLELHDLIGSVIRSIDPKGSNQSRKMSADKLQSDLPAGYDLSMDIGLYPAEPTYYHPDGLDLPF